MFCSPGRIFIDILGFPIYYYGLLMGISILIAVLLGNRIATVDYNKPHLIIDISPTLIIAGIIGARLYYCLLNFHEYIKTPLEIFDFRGGGLSIHGAIFAGLIVLFYESKKRGLSFGKLCDIFAISIPIAQSIGRWGNFFNNEAFGLPTNLPWKLYIPIECRPSQFMHQQFFHPTFLYESIFDLIIFIVLYFFLKNKFRNQNGILASIYLIMYSTVRIFIESMRIDCTSYILNIPTPIIVSIIIITLSSTYLIYTYLKEKTKLFY